MLGVERKIQKFVNGIFMKGDRKIDNGKYYSYFFLDKKVAKNQAWHEKGPPRLASLATPLHAARREGNAKKS